MLRVKKWAEFQHYKKRSPPWIRFYRAILDDAEFAGLALAHQAILMKLWLVASEYDGEIPADCTMLAWRLRTTVDEMWAALQAIIALGFLSLDGEFTGTHASTTLATCYSRAEESRDRAEQRQSVELRSTHVPDTSSVERETAARRERESAIRLAVEVVFAYWRAKMGKSERTLLDPKRAGQLTARLRENGGDVSELLYAVDGARRDDWTMGRAANSPRAYNGVETLFRDRAQVERLVELVPARLAIHPYLEQERAG